MGRVEIFLKRDKGKKSKKYRVYIGILVGVLIGVGILFGLLWFAEVDNYINSKEIVKIYNTYDKNLGSTENIIYYLGDSTALYSIYPPSINEKINENGYNITLIGLGIGNDAPDMRTLQIQNIIDSKPCAVFYALSYRSLTDYKQWVSENLYLVHDKLKIRDDSLYLYTKEEINDMNYVMNPYDKHIFFSSAMDMKLKKVFAKEVSPENDLWHEEDGFYFNLGVGRPSMQHSSEEIIKAAKDPHNEFRAEVTSESNKNKEALLYFAKSLANNDIPLIFICAPINPILADEISDESRQNYHDFFNSTCAAWYDMEYAVNNSTCFIDVYHMNEKGTMQFSELLSDIIIQEVS